MSAYYVTNPSPILEWNLGIFAPLWARDFATDLPCWAFVVPSCCQLYSNRGSSAPREDCAQTIAMTRRQTQFQPIGHTRPPCSLSRPPGSRDSDINSSNFNIPRHVPKPRTTRIVHLAPTRMSTSEVGLEDLTPLHQTCALNTPAPKLGGPADLPSPRFSNLIGPLVVK